MSSALIWEIVKKSNAFAVRGETGSRPRFSRERGNLKGVHSFKYSGETEEREREREEARKRKKREHD